MCTDSSSAPDYGQFCACMDLIVTRGTASADMLSNELSIPHSLAIQLIEIYESGGLIGPDRGDGTHAVILSPEFWARLRSQYAAHEDAVQDIPPSAQPSPITSPAPSRPRRNAPVGLTIQQLDEMEGHAFEHACADLLDANGFSRIKVTRASGDYGIDVLAEKDGERYAIQCKCYSSPIGNHAVEEAYSGAAYYDGRTPVVMSNQNFTAAAQNMAHRIGVLLWDRAKIQQMLRVYESDAQRKRRLLKRAIYIIGYLLVITACILVLLFVGSIFFVVGTMLFLFCFISIPLYFILPQKRQRRRRRRRR